MIEPCCIFKAGWYCVIICGRSTHICLIDQNIILTRSTKGHLLGYFNMFKLLCLFTAISGILVDVDCHNISLHYFILCCHAEPWNVMLDWYHLHTCSNIQTHTALTEINTHFYKQCTVIGFSRMSVCDMRLQVNYLKWRDNSKLER